MKPNVDQRFWSKVNKTEGCWEWSGVKSGKGYGNFKLDGSMRLAHRVSYELTVGPIPKGTQIDHTCHNRGCVNPAHLRPASNKQNMENADGAHANSRSGLRGVVRVGTRWRAQAKHNGVNHYAGTHSSPELAAEAARLLRLSLFTHNNADRASA